MEGLIATAVVLVLAVVALMARRASRSRDALDEEAWLPRELAGAGITFAEQTFRSERLRISARPDLVYAVRGERVLVELKTRASGRIHRSDVIELSAQRAAVSDVTVQRVADRGYVIIQDSASGRRVAHPVRLLSEREVAGLVDRWLAVRKGSAVPWLHQTR